PFPLCRRPPPPASSTLSLHDALPIFEARHVAPASVRAAVAPEVRGEGGDAEVRQTLAERRVQAAVLAEVVHEHRCGQRLGGLPADRKSTRLNSSHVKISYAVFCLKKK